MKNDGKIHIPGKKVTTNKQGMIRIMPEAYDALVEVVNESRVSLKQVASEIILQAIEQNLIEFDRDQEEQKCQKLFVLQANPVQEKQHQ